MLPNLSVVVITRNEASRIKACLEAVRWADEIIVVDSGSTDGTVQIATNLGARVVHHDFAGYGAQKNVAVSLATASWVLSIDADEIVTEALSISIRRVIMSPEELTGKKHNSSGEILPAAYRFRRRFVFLGKVFRHGSDSVDHPIRLFRRTKARFSDDLVHESLIVDGPIAEIDGEMLHHSYETLSQYFQKFDRYTDLAAEQLFAKNSRRNSLLTALLQPLYFVRHYILGGHILNGWHGFIWSIFSSWYPVVKIAKLEALRRSRR